MQYSPQQQKQADVAHFFIFAPLHTIGSVVQWIVLGFPKPSIQVRFLTELLKTPFMFYAYVIKSIAHDFYYKGHCENLEERLAQHNSGFTTSIKPYIPFKFAYYEEFATREEAILREKYFKTSAGRRFLKSKLAP